MLDDLDRKIISYLQYDGRMPFTQIATELGTTEGTVRRRTKQLIDSGAMQIVAIVEPHLAKKVHGEVQNSDVLFYINPSNKGSITSRKEIEYHLRKNEYRPLHFYTEPKSDIYFIQNLLENLSESYEVLGFREKEEKVMELLRLI